MEPNEILQWLSAQDPIIGYAILAVASVLEYVFPPLPGDTVTIGGAVMVGAAGWSLPAVIAATTAGSVAGALLDFEVGRWMARSERETWLHRLLRSEKWQPRVDSLCRRFARHGAIYIVANRFLPAIRGIFFVVAGMAGLRRREVALYALISALAWNSLLIAVGSLVGFNLDALMEIWRKYTSVVTVGVVLVILGWFLWSRRRR